VVRLALTLLASMIGLSCGDVYRPVVIPINLTPPNPSNFHAVFGISNNVPYNQGAALQIDVSGDSNIGEANMGVNPTHAAILPNDSRVFVASAGTLNAGGADVVTAFTPAADSSTGTGLGTPTVFTYPNVGPIDSTTGIPQWTCSYLPDFLATTQISQVFVANYGVEGDANCTPFPTSTDSVASLGVASGSVGTITYLPAGSHPVALAETPNAQHLYVVNQGNNTVVDLSPTDLSTIATISVSATPVWAVARSDNQRIYVLSQGTGTLIPIDTASDTVIPSQTNLSVGAGANFILYDSHLNRLYVTNPTTATVYVFSTTGGVDLTGTANDTPVLLSTISMTAGSNPPCPSGCSPVSVAALADGSRFYVASYASETACTDANVGPSSPCIIPMLTVFDALSMTVKPATSTILPSSPSLSLLSTPQFAATQYSVQPLASCVPAATYTPGTTRFRMFTTAAADSSHVYVSICDAGSIADINTTTSTVATGSNSPDTLVTDIPAPFGSCNAISCGTVTTITSFKIVSNVVTFQAVNNLTAGSRVSISGLGSQVGLQLDGQTLTVLSSGLSGTQFEGVVSMANAGPIADVGSAIPLSPPQSPIFLLTGQ
jgi:DNA-binding beta-propeller fold protein YncE